MARITVDFVDDWIERLRGRIYTQWRDAEGWNGFAEFLGRAAQDWENAAQTLFSAWDIDNSEGVQLDNIGRVVGQPRTVTDDATYRMYLKARVLANRSTGGPEEIYKVFRALYGDDIGQVVLSSPIKTLVLRIKGAISATMATYGPDFLRDSKEAGARGLFEWQQADDEDMFTCASGSVLSSAVSAGGTSLPVESTVDFLSTTSTLVIDVGTPTQETIAASAWSVAGGTELTVSALTFAHSSGVFVEYTNGPGKGFGNETDSTVGGEFADAVLV